MYKAEIKTTKTIS